MTEYMQQLECAKRAAVDAGKAIATYYGQVLKVTHKSASQPLTDADLASNRIIKETLRSEFPKYGWLSEEDVDDDDRLDQSVLWVIDPLDGTRDFINRNPEFAVSIALVVEKKPVVGVVYNPVTKELFYAAKGYGSHCNGKPIKVKTFTSESHPSLVVSQSEYNRGEWAAFENEFKITPTGGCAYKMGKVARGDADGTFTLSPKSEWDICAGTLLVEEAGGVVTYVDGSAVTFNNASTLMDGLIYCNSSKLLSRIIESIQRHDKSGL